MTSGDWTPEAERAIALCTTWATQVQALIPCHIYLFGSAIYDSGDQFDAQFSDLDLVILFTDPLDANRRVERLVALRSIKASLELQMIPALHRTNCEDSGVSVVPIMDVELRANIHKSGARRFFDRNIYFDLQAEEETVGLPHAGTCFIPDEARQALEYVQKVRNQFLAVSANGTGGIPSFDGADPIPKSLARVAAQLVPDPAVGAWYDTRFGLEFLWQEVERRRSDSDAMAALYRTLSKRRGGRGKRGPLSDLDQLLLAEVLYDLAAAVPLESTIVWEIRFTGASSTIAERARLLRLLSSLVPDAQIIGIYEGSVIIRLRSAKRGYTTLKRLEELGMLPIFFGVEEISVSSSASGKASGFERTGLIDRIVEHIASWRPQSADQSGRVSEAELVLRLQDWLRRDEVLAHASLAPEAPIALGEHTIRADILLQFREFGEERRVAIEVTRLRGRKTFFEQIERARRIPMPVILVLLGKSGELENLRPDIEKLSDVDGAIRVVPVLLDNG